MVVKTQKQKNAKEEKNYWRERIIKHYLAIKFSLKFIKR